MALGICFWSSSVKYFGRAHQGRTVEGPEKLLKVMRYMEKEVGGISYYKWCQIPASSGPGMNKNRLCSFSRGWAAIICPSLPNCNLQVEVSNSFYSKKLSFFFVMNYDNAVRTNCSSYCWDSTLLLSLS